MTVDAIHHVVRPARPDEATACADLKWMWMRGVDWMPDKFSQDGVRGFHVRVIFAEWSVWVIGEPLAGYLALDGASVEALYVATPGQGLGKALLDHVKATHPTLELWTFQANDGARRFYAREGFREVRSTDGDNMEGLPDVLLRWEAP